MTRTRCTGVGFTHHQAIISLPRSGASTVRAPSVPWGSLGDAKEHKNCRNKTV